MEILQLFFRDFFCWNFILIERVCLFTLLDKHSSWWHHACAMTTKASCLRVETSLRLFVVVLCSVSLFMSHIPNTCALHCILNALQVGLGSFSLIFGLSLIGFRLLSLPSLSQPSLMMSVIFYLMWTSCASTPNLSVTKPAKRDRTHCPHM